MTAAVRESAVEAHLVKVAALAGGLVRKVQWIGRRGAPDRLVMLRAFKGFPARTVWVEVKRPKGGVLEDHQIREHARMREHGQEVVVLWTIADIDTFFEERRTWYSN